MFITRLTFIFRFQYFDRIPLLSELGDVSRIEIQTQVILSSVDPDLYRPSKINSQQFETLRGFNYWQLITTISIYLIRFNNNCSCLNCIGI